MESYQAADFDGLDFSIAMTGELDDALAAHFGRDSLQEDLAFAYWRPSKGSCRYTAVLHALCLPGEDEHILHGNVAFTPEYLSRVIEECPAGSGIAFLHGHPGPGWQGMSEDDIVAERDRLAGLVAGATGLPLVGLTWGTDRTWSGRLWLRVGRHQYERRWCTTIRSVGRRLRMSFHPQLAPPPATPEAQVATASVWGEGAQQDIARVQVGIVGLGSVGSIVAEALSRTGVGDLSFIDHDFIEERNLDRTLGAKPSLLGRSKVASAQELVETSHTAEAFRVTAVEASLLDEAGLAAALDCDVLFSCVDRPLPRHVLNLLAYSHLIPVVDGGILARVDERGRLVHVDWRIHTVGPEQACLYCLGALRRSDVALDRDGKLDDPDYLNGLSPADRERYGRRNVFAFSLSVAAHEVLQFVGLLTGNPRVGGIGPQTYHAFPGEMAVTPNPVCAADCDIAPLTAQAPRLQ